MALFDSIRNTLLPETQPGELSSQGVVDKWAGLGLVAAGVLYVLFTALGGMVRGVFGPIGLAILVYLPAIVGIPALLANTLTRVGVARTSTGTIAVLVFLAIEIEIALMLGRQAKAIIFEFYIFVAALVIRQPLSGGCRSGSSVR